MARRKWCNGVGPRGYLCTEPWAHPGDHIAKATGDEVCETWPRGDLEQAAQSRDLLRTALRDVGAFLDHLGRAAARSREGTVTISVNLLWTEAARVKEALEEVDG